MDDQLPEAADDGLPCPPGFAGSAVRHREPGDLVALRVEAAAMTGVALAGVGWIPRRRNHTDPAGPSAPFMV